MNRQFQAVIAAAFAALAGLLVSLLGAMLVSALAAGSAIAEVLEGKIEHVQVMPSLSEDLQPGRRFSLSLFEGESPSNEWVQLPDWMAGKWSLKNETAVLRIDFRAGTTNTTPYNFRADSTFEYGMQKDRLGHVWHYIGTPYHSKTGLMMFDEYHLVTGKHFNRSDEEEVAFTSVVTVARVRPIDRHITEVFQQESITSYRPIPSEGGTLIKLSASTKSFDKDGQPLVQTDNVARVKKIRPFTPINQYQGKNMKELFREFLIAKGLTNLLPD